LTEARFAVAPLGVLLSRDSSIGLVGQT
jgi:hypothetical protein